MIFDTPSGIASVNLPTLGSKPPKIEIVVPGARAIATARRTREVYFSQGGTLYAANLDTHAIREVTKARGRTINADETFVVSTVTATDPTGKTRRPEPRTILPQRERMFPGKTQLTPEEERAAQKEDWLSRRLANPISEAFVFTNIKTGESKTNGYQYAWLNHLQFSPTDPNLLLYCHEGTWHEVDRIWTIRTDGTERCLMHKRTMDMEIAGHEFWSYDGKTIWFDLQTPRSKEFWLAGLNIDTGKEIRYKLERDWWSIHYNVSRDGKLFAGDGGDPGQVAFAKNGLWINLFRPQPDGTMTRERLVNMSKHNYGWARTQRDDHARREVGRLHIQHVRADPRLRRRNSEGEVKELSTPFQKYANETDTHPQEGKRYGGAVRSAVVCGRDGQSSGPDLHGARRSVRMSATLSSE